ncbi:MAG: hypothetical protein IT556_16915, partial [Acetobacteraceae bacterium]|nr:hypothetical protein [Acetobacteraceae bacterium]
MSIHASPPPPHGLAAVPAPEPPAQAVLRGVHRAVSDLRRGVPVVLTAAGAGAAWLVAAAETVGARGILAFAALGAGPPLLLLASGRAASVL